MKTKKKETKEKKIKSNPLEATPSSLLIYARIRKGIKKKGKSEEEDMGRQKQVEMWEKRDEDEQEQNR